MHSKNPHSAWRKLDRHNKIEFGEATAAKQGHSSVKIVIDAVSRTKSRACFRGYKFLDWKNPVGFTTFATWEGFKYCWKITKNGPGVMVVNRRTSQGGETDTPGWSYDGVVNDSSSGTGTDFADQVSETEFAYGFGTWGPLKTDACEQLEAQSGQTQWFVERTCQLGAL
jgi:hypothetical protein